VDTKGRIAGLPTGKPQDTTMVTNKVLVLVRAKTEMPTIKVIKTATTVVKIAGTLTAIFKVNKWEPLTAKRTELSTAKIAPITTPTLLEPKRAPNREPVMLLPPMRPPEALLMALRPEIKRRWLKLSKWTLLAVKPITLPNGMRTRFR
jgi:hypothetical protein